MKININCCHRSDCADTHCPGRPDASGCEHEDGAYIGEAIRAVAVVLMCIIVGLSTGWLVAIAFDAAGLR